MMLENDVIKFLIKKHYYTLIINKLLVKSNEKNV